MSSYLNSPTGNQPVTMVNVCCPDCEAEILVENDPGVATVGCASCNREFSVTAGMRLLDWVEYMVRRMVVGLVEFACQRVPAWFYSVVVGSALWVVNFMFWLVPLSAKVVRVTGWVGLWLSIPLGPTLALGLVAASAWRFPKAEWLALALATAAVLWFVVVVGGYTWAYWHYRGRRRKAAGGSGVIPQAQNHKLCPAGK